MDLKGLARIADSAKEFPSWGEIRKAFKQPYNNGVFEAEKGGVKVSVKLKRTTSSRFTSGKKPVPVMWIDIRKEGFNTTSGSPIEATDKDFTEKDFDKIFEGNIGVVKAAYEDAAKQAQKVGDSKRPKPAQRAKIKDEELTEEQLTEIFDDPGDEFFNKIMNEAGAEDLDNDCDADGYMVEIEYFDGEIVKRYGQDPENMWTLDGDLKKWANASLERACKRFKKEMLRVAKKCNAAVLISTDDPTERVYAKFVDPRLVEPYELKPTWKPGDAPIKDAKKFMSRKALKIKDSASEVGFYQELTPEQMLELVDDIAHFHGELYEIEKPTFCWLAGNGADDFRIVALDELVKWIEDNIDPDYLDEEAKEKVKTLEGAKEWIKSEADTCEIEEPGLYWITDEVDFEAVRIKTLDDLFEATRMAEFFYLNATVEDAKRWIQEAKEKNDDNAVDNIEDRFDEELTEEGYFD